MPDGPIRVERLLNADSEADRIRAEYARRDAAARATQPVDGRAVQAYLQDLEWQLLRALDAAGTSLVGASVLDVGAGDGHLLSRLLDFGAISASGIELSEHRAAKARERRRGLDVRQGDASRMPYPDASFDVVTQFTCLSSVLDAGVRSHIAAEMRRVVRPGGTLVSYDLRPAPRPIRELGRLARRAAERRGPAWTPVEPLGRDELGRLFGDGQWTIRETTLNAALPAVLRRSRAGVLALSAVPALRSHLLAVLRIPG